MDITVENNLSTHLLSGTREMGRRTLCIEGTTHLCIPVHAKLLNVRALTRTHTYIKIEYHKQIEMEVVWRRIRI